MAVPSSCDRVSAADLMQAATGMGERPGNIGAILSDPGRAPDATALAVALRRELPARYSCLPRMMTTGHDA
jgi:hypothetical protein